MLLEIKYNKYCLTIRKKMYKGFTKYYFVITTHTHTHCNKVHTHIEIKYIFIET